jgi:hypothetical protein
MTDRCSASSTACSTDEILRVVLTEGLAPATVLSVEQFDALWCLATRSRVHLLVAHALLGFEELIPVERRQGVMDCLRKAQALELLRCRELRRIVNAFDSASVPVLLLKGCGLAYTEYASAYLRPASDIDLFVAPDTLTRAENALIASGYERRLEPDVESASGQRHYERDDGFGKQLVDLHWRVSNVRLFAGVLSFEEAWHWSVTVPRLGQSARTLRRIDALLLACVHRVAHHYDDPDLLWIWDVHLLCRHMTEDDADRIVAAAASRRVCSVIARSLNLTCEQFGTIVPDGLADRLAEAGSREAAARFVGGRFRPIDVLRSDLAAGSLRTNLQLLREHLVPPRAYMRRMYPRWPAVLLPIAYVHRVCRGVPKWFVHP